MAAEDTPHDGRQYMRAKLGTAEEWRELGCAKALQPPKCPGLVSMYLGSYVGSNHGREALWGTSIRGLVRYGDGRASATPG